VIWLLEKYLEVNQLMPSFIFKVNSLSKKVLPILIIIKESVHSP
jgi:hypothetical protein